MLFIGIGYVLGFFFFCLSWVPDRQEASSMPVMSKLDCIFA